QSYLTTPFIGKRLFTDEFIEEDDQDGTEDQPINVNNVFQVSPDVQILGERVFNGSCSNMVNTVDNLYKHQAYIRQLLKWQGKSASQKACTPKQVSMLTFRARYERCSHAT
uniref:Uncharacterized protein n=1 Tax=Aegilops tauschii subsp. strangulata TaxID=200361 RepID=A0A453M3K2_AEGTS